MHLYFSDDRIRDRGDQVAFVILGHGINFIMPAGRRRPVSRGDRLVGNGIPSHGGSGQQDPVGIKIHTHYLAFAIVGAGITVVARIQAIIRRSAGHSQSVIDTGLLSVNLDAHTAEVSGQSIHLTGKEYGILELLSLRKGTTLTKEMFLNHLYGGMDEPELKIIDVFICKLRKKLSTATGSDTYIETVWGRGYVLRDPDGDSQQTAAKA